MKFEVLGSNSEVLQTIHCETIPVRIGSNPNCELCLKDASVSRIHAVLEKTDQGYRISDRLSASGSYVDKQKVEPSKSARVKNGSLLTFGKVTVRLSYEEEAVAKPQPIVSAKPKAPAMMPKVPMPAAQPVVTTIIKKKKQPVSFERRFLSSRAKSSNCKLEVAMVWHDTVLRIEQFAAKGNAAITVGADSHSTFQVSLDKPLRIAQCVSGKWEILLNPSLQGFVLVDDKKFPFGEASSADFSAPHGSDIVSPGTLCHGMDGNTRAKYVFGEISLLVRCVDAVPYAKKWALTGNYSSLAASLLIHFALFSVILFATNRADALMVDRIMSTSRFATVVEEMVPEETAKDIVEEELVKEEVPDESVEAIPRDSDSSKMADYDKGSDGAPGQGLSRSQAEGIAKASGLLAQETAMNSMLAVASSFNADVLEWSTFDAGLAAQAQTYGLGATGVGDGSPGLGTMNGAHAFGPQGNGKYAGIRKAGEGYNGPLGKHDEKIVKVISTPFSVEGTIDKRIVQKVVRSHMGELRSCYEKELATVKGLHGRVVVFWLITPQGNVSKALVKETTLKNKNVENCVVNFIHGWRFPALKGGSPVGVDYPFVFETNGNN